MRIVSWNVNSVRLRLEGLEMLVRTLAPDVLCLQEIKARNEAFPKDVLRSLGYEHGVVHGQAGYHGVATFARRPIEDVESLVWCGKPDARHLRVRIAGIAVHNLYVPAGGDPRTPSSATSSGTSSTFWTSSRATSMPGQGTTRTS